MNKIRRSNIIAISVIIGILTIISALSLSAAVAIPSPGNGGAVILTWISGIVLGLCLVTLMLTMSEK
jgi:hypothetical protein